MKKVTKAASVRPTKTPISDKTLQKAAARLLPMAKQLVSIEIAWLQRVLSVTATQKEIDERVTEVRRLPWASISGE